MSTYSPSLRIELITTGTQAGTWGNTTNTNLGGLIESAIAGYVSVSITSANQALTALNGAPDESRNQTIALTTTTTAAFNVYAPPAEKTYVIYNASSYAATLFNSTILGNTTAAGTGVVIPAGRTVTVWSDGTNFRAQNDHLPTATTAATAAFGTNTTQLATTAFVQAALQALHPVGSVYINATNNTNPATLLGFGTWTAFGAGRVPVGFNASNPLFDTAEETGGSYDATVVSHSHTGTTGGQSADHTHSGVTSTEGTHAHNIAFGYSADHDYFGNNVSSFTFNGGGVTQNPYNYGTDAAGAHNHGFTTGGVSNSHSHSFTTDSSGSSATNANIQPYITVYMWKRTA
jgi:hypothetical protein